MYTPTIQHRALQAKAKHFKCFWWYCPISLITVGGVDQINFQILFLNFCWWSCVTVSDSVISFVAYVVLLICSRFFYLTIFVYFSHFFCLWLLLYFWRSKNQNNYSSKSDHWCIDNFQCTISNLQFFSTD